MKRRIAYLVALILALTLFLGGCASGPREATPLAIANTSGTTTVDGTDVPYEYDGEFYILAGDMLFHTLEDLRSYVSSPFGDTSLQAAQTAEPDGVLNPGNQWPQGRIPYQIKDFSSSSAEYNAIEMSMVHWEQETGIRFYPSSTNGDRLVISRYSASNCEGSATVGFGDSSVQPANVMRISSGCVGSGDRRPFMLAIVRHELGHVIGFFHEHQRKDRDNHVNYNPENVIDSNYARSQFVRLYDTSNSFIPVGYDFDSIMHYDPYAWSLNPGNTNFRTLERIGNPSYALGSSTVSGADVYSTERYYRGENPCGYLNTSYPANCRRLGGDLSSTDTVDYFEFTNSTANRQHLGWLISDDYHPDPTKANLSYQLELQQLSGGTWKVLASTSSSQGSYVSLSRSLNSGSYRWAFKRVSGTGFYDFYRTYEP